MRIGHGYDVHRLEEGRPCILGGVRIPFPKGPFGHSDADVLLHAVSDALLGAAGRGDIGKWFPDTDPAYLNADSLELLKQIVMNLEQSGFSVSNVDATVLAEAPKIGPYTEEMCRNIALACHVPAERVNVKGTTEEGLGFTGTGEGFAAHAVVLLKERGDV